MEGKAIVCVVVGALGLIAVILAFAAEGTRIKAEQVVFTDDGYCIYPSSASTGLGIVAVIILLIEQIIISVATNCICCCKGTDPRVSDCHRITSITCFVFSWLAFIGAIVLLIEGGIVNNFEYLANVDATSTVCLVGKSGLFAGGGVMAIVSIALGLVSYLALKTSTNPINTGSTNLANERGVALAKPQMPSN